MFFRIAACTALTVSVLAGQTSAKNPFANDAKAAEAGRLNFRIYCSPCHGLHAQGGKGPDLTRGTYNAGDQDSDLFHVISSGVTNTEMSSYADQLSSDYMWQIISYIRSVARHETAGVQGDAHAGEQVFWAKGGCGGCHQVGQRGGRLGPTLTRIGRTRSLAYLRESIVDPHADITGGYSTITVVTKDGKKVVGVDRGYDNFSARLMDTAGRLHSFDRDEVTSMKREPRSVMPDTYKKTLSEKELNDVLAYVVSLRGEQ